MKFLPEHCDAMLLSMGKTKGWVVSEELADRLAESEEWADRWAESEDKGGV